MVHLVALLEAAQDRDRVLDRRLTHVDLLEAPLQRGVLLDVLAVLVERRRADQPQLAAGEHRLDHVACVDRAFGAAGTDDRVDLVDERDDLTLGVGDLLEHRLEPLLELAAVLRARDQRADVERDDALVAQTLGNVALDDAAREPFDDRGLADAGLADEHRVVLRAPRQHLDDAADLLVAADDRIDLALARGLGEIAPVLLERLVLLFGIVARDAMRTAHLAQRVEHRVVVDADAAEKVADPAGHLGHREQDVLGREVVVVQGARARRRRSRARGTCSRRTARRGRSRRSRAGASPALRRRGGAPRPRRCRCASSTPVTMPSLWSSSARNTCSGAISVLPASRASACAAANASCVLRVNRLGSTAMAVSL